MSGNGYQQIEGPLVKIGLSAEAWIAVEADSILNADSDAYIQTTFFRSKSGFR